MRPVPYARLRLTDRAALGVVDLATDRSNLTEWGGTPVSIKIPQATMNGFGIAMIVVSLVANFWATGLIAVKAWCVILPQPI